MSYENCTADSPEETVNLFARNFQTYYRKDDNAVQLDSLINECNDDAIDIPNFHV